MKFVNRTEERKFMKNIVNSITEGQETCVWIEGTRGAGKSYFIKYIQQDSDMPMFIFDGYNWIYKCNESTIDNEYQFFIDVINVFQHKNPKKFNDFLFNYFNNIYDVSWVETLACIIPNIKLTEWAKDAINKPLAQIEQAKTDVSNMLYKSGLRNFLASMVIYFLTEVEHKRNIVFCIDDACWLDEYSISTIMLMLNLAKHEKKSDINISFIILTRPLIELDLKKENYNLLETGLKDVYGNIKYIRIKNFDYEATKEYIELMDKNYVREITHNIYKVTNGNPQDLYQTLKFSDYELEGLVQNDREVVGNNFISAELIIKLATENTYTLPIIGSISLLHQKMRPSWLLTITKSFCKQILDEDFNTIKYDSCLQLLKEHNIINICTDIIEILHDSLKETAIEYIKNSGEYLDYMNCLTSTIINIIGLNDLFVKEIMYLYNEYNPIRCFHFFAENQEYNACFMDGGIIKLVAQSLSRENSLYTSENIEKTIVPIVVDRCIRLSYYDLAYRICSLISTKVPELNREILYKYYIYFAKVLIDKGMLQTTEEFGAIEIIERILYLPELSADEQIECYLLAMSAYEHLLDFNSIKKYNTLAQKVIGNNNVDALYHTMYLRNQGLVESHCVLGKKYLLAVEYSKSIENTFEKKLMLGTCHNNLGLHYLYTTDVSNALKHFEYAEKYLEEIGYDTFRVLNNIAICYMFRGKDENAYDFLLQAKSLNVDCVFEKLCIQSNISILEYKLGKRDIAKDIAMQIIKEYRDGSKQTNDDLVYSSAMVNMAYFCYKEEDFVCSAKWYKESMFFNYRYNDELQKKKRQEMLNLCMCHLGVSETTVSFIDSEDVNTNLFSKMYAPIPFAYYIV